MVPWLDALYETLIGGSARSFESALNGRRFIVGIDEVMELDSRNRPAADNMPTDGSSLIALQRIIKTLDSLDMWHILVDTSSGIQGVFPVTGEKAKSGRLVTDLIPLPVYPYIQWDIMVEKSQAPKTPGEALLLKHLKKFGRPVCVHSLHGSMLF